jgi:putative ABC transport system permease protein
VTRDDDGADAPPRLARWLVRMGGLLAPRDRREAWREEWSAELWHEARRPGQRDERRRAVVRAALGAPRDALAMRIQPGTPYTEQGLSKRTREEFMNVLSDLRIALRGIRRSPGFTLLAVLTLGLGIGANAALFTVVDSVLLRPLPYPNADRLVRVLHSVPYAGPVPWQMSPHGFYLFQDRNTVFEEMGAHVSSSFNVTFEGVPDRASARLVSASLLRTLGARAVVGRLLEDADNLPGAADVAVLGHEFWQRRFAGDARVVGSVVQLNGEPFEIVGVTNPGFGLPQTAVDLWVPLELNRATTPQNSHYFSTIARLRTGVTLEQAQAEAEQLVGRFTQELPTAYDETWIRESGFGTQLVPLHQDVVGNASRALWIVFGAVGLVLLIACANVANLFLVRSEARRREVAVRNALGATRSNLLRQFFTESTVLAVLAGALGLFIAWAGVRLLIATSPGDIPRLDEVSLRGATVAFTAAITILASVAFGMFPLLHVRRNAQASALFEGTARSTVGRARQRVRSALVIAQVAFALMLLAGAGLLMRSAAHLKAIDPGFETDGVLAFELTLTRAGYPNHAAVEDFHRRLRTELTNLPGVTGAGAVNLLPLRKANVCFTLHPADRPPATGEILPCIDYAIATAGWFETMRIPVRGSTLSDEDSRSGVNRVVITEALAQRFWPDGDALGRRLTWGSVTFEVVGVANDIRQRGLDEPVPAMVWLPVAPAVEGPTWYLPTAMTVTVRTTRPDPASLTADARAALARVDGDVPLAGATTMQRVLEQSMARISFLLLMIGIAASVALALGVIGLYGVIAYIVAQRRAEIGIRMALGAQAADVGRRIMLQAMILAALGIALGVLGVVATAGALQSLLFEVRALDPLTIASVALLLMIVAALAAWLPASSAARIDPVETMRGS